MLIVTTINITREINSDTDGTFEFDNIRQAIRDALDSNFYSILSRNGIDTISSITADPTKEIAIAVSNTSNELFINKTVNDAVNTIATISYNPYISYVKYRQYVKEDSIGIDNDYTPANIYKPFATILLTVLIDGNICGFSLLSPADLILVDEENGIYEIRNNTENNNYEDIDVTTLPEIIKLQSKVIFDNNSYYEISYSDVNTPYESTIVPCVNSIVYDENNNSNSFKSLFNNLYVNFDTPDNENISGSVMLLPKMLCSATDINTVSNNITGYANTIFDCPQLNVNHYWSIDSDFNIGDAIVVGDSEYIISNKNTLIQLTNTEIYGVNKTYVYDGKPHFFDLVYPKNGKAYYKFSGNESAEWIELPNDLSTITDYVDAQTYLFDYKVVITTNNVTKEYYGNVQLVIESANQYGYLVDSYDGDYDALPHSLYIYTDANVEYSLDNANWSSTAPTFTNVGTYTVYYRLTKNNYTTVIDSVDINIQTISAEQMEENNFGIDISKNIIVMREQLYANTKSNLFLEVKNNNVYLSNTLPTYINVDNFVGQFPDPTSSVSLQSVLGSFNVSAGDYYLVIETYMPWYYQGVEPTPSNQSIDNMLTRNPITFTIDYCNGADVDVSLDNSNWITIADNIAPSNGFYEYKITNIDIGENSVGNLWSGNMAMASTKRVLVKLSLSADVVGNETKSIRIICNHTNEVQYNPATSLPFNSTITNANIGISLITLNKFTTPSTVIYSTVNYGGDTYYQIPLKFKSQLNSNAYFAYNSGNNLEYCGCGELNYAEITLGGTTFPGVDTTTGIYDNKGITLWKNGVGSSIIGNMANNWTANNYFTILKDVPIRIQFNPYVIEQTISRDNVDKIYSYVNCN